MGLNNLYMVFVNGWRAKTVPQLGAITDQRTEKKKKKGGERLSAPRAPMGEKKVTWKRK